MADRCGRRETFFSPEKVSFDSRGRVITWTFGTSASMRPRIVAGADQQRLLAAALVEQAVGEDVAAVEIGGELDLVDRDEGEVEIARHRLDGRDPVARSVRLDLLLAGDQRDVVGARLLDDALIDLAGEQPQRQADHAALVAEHALDGEMGLAGVGRPEHGRDAARAQLRGKGTASHLHEYRVSQLRSPKPRQGARAGEDDGWTGRSPDCFPHIVDRRAEFASRWRTRQLAPRCVHRAAGRTGVGVSLRPRRADRRRRRATRIVGSAGARSGRRKASRA